MTDSTWVEIVRDNPKHQWPLHIDVTVEVTRFEYYALWENHSRQSRDVRSPQVKWNENLIGLLTCLYGNNTFPTCLHLRVDTLTLNNGRVCQVLFWELTSGVRDVVLARDWIDKNFKYKKNIDANDFHSTLENFPAPVGKT